MRMRVTVPSKVQSTALSTVYIFQGSLLIPYVLIDADADPDPQEKWATRSEVAGISC